MTGRIAIADLEEARYTGWTESIGSIGKLQGVVLAAWLSVLLDVDSSLEDSEKRTGMPPPPEA